MKIEDEDKSINKKIGEYGNIFIKEGVNIFIYCNVGVLVIGGYGIVFGVVCEVYFIGKNIYVYVDEIWLYLQGVRFIVFEFFEDGIFNIVICDNMVGYFMKFGKIDCVIVGVDRIVLNGDMVNKIGIYFFFVLVKYYGIFFYIVVFVLIIDFNIKFGLEIFIEERSEDEIRFFNGKKIVLDELKVFNFVFDVMLVENIIVIIIEKGVVFLLFEENILKFKEKQVIKKWGIVKIVYFVLYLYIIF